MCLRPFSARVPLIRCCCCYCYCSIGRLLLLSCSLPSQLDPVSPQSYALPSHAAGAAAAGPAPAWADPARAERLSRLADTVSQHFLVHAAHEGQHPPSALGLKVLADAPPADVTLVATEQQTSSGSGAASSSTSTPTTADGSLEGTIQSTGEDAMKVLLLPNKPGVPGVRVVIGAVS